MQASALNEWRKYWTLAIAAALGNSVLVLPVYSLGPFMEPLEQEFGWGRAQISFGLTISTSIAAVLGIGTGALLDRFGPRPIGLLGAVLMCSAYALLGTATASLVNWYLLWCLVAIGQSTVKPTVWTSAVASRFDASRGVAIAVTISGAGASAAIIPGLATWAIASFGWRSGFFGLGSLWAAVVLPVLLLFFFGKQDRHRQKRARNRGKAGPAETMDGMTVAAGLRSAPLYKLGIAGMVYAFAVVGLMIHFLPILQDAGLDRLTAGSIAGLIGLSSIVGRLGTGFLLDRFREDRVAMIAFLMPVVTAAMLLLADGPVMFAVAATILGLSLGSELDVIMYLATRHFGLKRFGVLFGVVLAAISFGSGLGPVSAGAFFDAFGHYSHFVVLVIPLVMFSSLLMATLGRYPDYRSRNEDTVQGEVAASH